MHEKIIASIQVSYPDQYEEVFSDTIKVGKDLTREVITTSLIQWLTNTNFRERLLHDFAYECNKESIKCWLNVCKREHESLTIENPQSDEYLSIGTFQSDIELTNYADLSIVYHRRYLKMNRGHKMPDQFKPEKQPDGTYTITFQEVEYLLDSIMKHLPNVVDPELESIYMELLHIYDEEKLP